VSIWEARLAKSQEQERYGYGSVLWFWEPLISTCLPRVSLVKIVEVNFRSDVDR
jgi:hypothetical protein